MIKYSDKAKKALAFFFRPFNDLDIYVEDAVCRNMYEILFNRIMNGKAKINRIFQLGDKYRVIEACRNDQSTNGRARLYIIDGDFELFLGKRKPRLKYLYRLNVYTSENLLLSENACIEVGSESLTNKSRSEITTILDYVNFMKVVTESLHPLFLIYLTSYFLDPSIETVGYHVYRLSNEDSDQFYLDKKLIEDRISEVKNKLLSKFLEIEVTSVLNKFEKSLKGVQKEKFISGKDYLFPLLFRHLCKRIKFNGKSDQLKCHLARHCALDIDPKLSKTILRTAKHKQKQEKAS